MIRRPVLLSTCPKQLLYGAKIDGEVQVMVLDSHTSCARYATRGMIQFAVVNNFITFQLPSNSFHFAQFLEVFDCVIGSSSSAGEHGSFSSMATNARQQGSNEKRDERVIRLSWVRSFTPYQAVTSYGMNVKALRFGRRVQSS